MKTRLSRQTWTWLIAGLLCSIAQAWTAEPGAAAFTRNCAQCHGNSPEAVGTQQLGRTRGKDKALLVGRKDLPKEYVRAVVRNGLKAMPSFTPAALTDAELADIAAYVTR